MWIDINSHVGHWPYRKLIYDDCDSLLQRMDRFGVDLSVVSSLSGIHFKNTQSANRELYHQWRSSEELKQRLVPYAVINPTYAGWKYDLKQCVEEYEMQGVAVYPKYHDYAVDHEALITLVETARDYDIPVALTLRMVDHRARFWMDVEREWALADVMPLIRSVPDAQYLIWNVANSTRLDENDLHLIKNAEVLMDTSGRATNHLSGLLELFGEDKFAFGSHAPLLDYATGRLRIEYLDHPETTRENLRSGNAARFLKLK